MNKQDIIDHFDCCAPQWDDNMIRNETVIERILNNAKVTASVDVLDVACGTGVLIPDYLKRGVASVTAVDISPKMVDIAKAKFQEANVDIICADIEKTAFEKKFDCVVVYNAFPHFPEPSHLIKVLSGYLKPNGTLTVAHGTSREKLNLHHADRAKTVSRALITADEMAALFAPYVDVTVIITDDTMYQVVGIKRQ